MPEFSLLTLNCFGTPAPGTAGRLVLLANLLKHEVYSMVCLQEVQTNGYRTQLVESCRPPYDHSAFAPFLHAPKGGLLTLSQPGIDDAEFVLYSERGLWYTPAIMDWVLHKGVLVARLTVEGVPVIVMNTHLTANYTGDWRESSAYARHEYNQLMQLAGIVRAQPDDAVVIVCGDFNIPRGTWLYERFIDASGLTDPLAHSTEPTFRPHTGMPSRYAVPIDFALYRTPALPRFAVSSDLRFRDKVRQGSRAVYISDHMGVELCLSWG